ncbi:hypothetical protein BC629DRAFT_554712 [Irpex lacteus]|nr:hypothetical protein BC629DRAFT_554712 [Irpex lacteus]
MFQFISGMDGHELVYDYPEDPEGGHFGIARSVFLDALVHHVDHQYTHFHKHCTSVSQPPPGSNSRPAAHFSDGTSVEADVILLADGIHGVGREAVTGRDPKEDVVFSNYVCYRGLVPSEDLHKAGVKTDLTKRPVCFTGVDKHLIVFPIRGDKVVNIVAFVMDRSVKVGSVRLPEGQPAVVSVTKEELLKDYEGWGSDVTYAKGSIALLGDAAHGMTPHLGSGAGTGIEDAYLLSQLLTHPQTTVDNIQNVLEVYSTIRRPRAQSVWDGSMRAGDIYEGYGEHGRAKKGMAQDLANLWSFVWSHDAEADYAKALKLLQEAAVFSAQ